MIEKRGKTESEAIGMAVGIVKRWARGGGNVDANTRAAAALAVKQWEEKKAKAHVSEAAPWVVRQAERWAREGAIARLVVLEGSIGRAGIGQLVDGRALLEHENDSEEALVVEALGEMARWDVLTAVSQIPSLGGLAEAALSSVPLAERFNPRELRNFRGRWEKGGGTPSLGALLTPPRQPSTGVAVPPRPRAAMVTPARATPRRPHSAPWQRYEGGVARMSEAARKGLRSAFTKEEKESEKQPQPHKTLDPLYALGGERQPEFEKVLDLGQGISKELGAQTQSTKTEEDFKRAISMVAADPNRSYVIVAALKGRDRALEKIERKYGGDASQLTDLVRGTVLVPHLDDLPGAIAAVRHNLPPGWKIVDPTNRFLKEKGSKVHQGDLNAYRDVSMLLVSPDGFHMELQINTTHLWLAKEQGEGHKLYEESRKIREAADHEGREHTAYEEKRLAYITRRNRELYGAALRASARSRKIVAAGLKKDRTR